MKFKISLGTLLSRLLSNSIALMKVGQLILTDLVHAPSLLIKYHHRFLLMR
mgnify:CR=1 FL=1